MITRMSHFGIVVNNLEESIKLWSETFGLKLIRTGSVEVEGIRNAFFQVGHNYIELMEPINKQDMNNSIAKRLATKGEGIYHVALVVDNLNEEFEKLGKKGVALIKRPPFEDEPQGRIVIHPKSANGVLLELVTKGI